MSTEAEDLLDAAAAKPEEAEVDGIKAKSRPLADLMKWADRKAAQEATTTGPGFRITKLIPPGAT